MATDRLILEPVDMVVMVEPEATVVMARISSDRVAMVAKEVTTGSIRIPAIRTKITVGVATLVMDTTLQTSSRNETLSLRAFRLAIEATTNVCVISESRLCFRQNKNVSSSREI